MDFWKKYQYKNLTLVFISLIAAFFLARYEPFHNFLLGLKGLGYLGAFAGGMLFVSTLTVATGAVILLVLAEKLSPIEIALAAGLGAVAGDLITFHLVRNTLNREIENIYRSLDHDNHILKLLKTRYFRWTLPFIGALIIASPLPDELGVSLLGISRMKTYQFLIVSFVLNSLGILFVVTASAIIKP